MRGIIKGILKLVVAVVLVLMVPTVLIGWLYFANRPPRETKIIKNFNRHRAQFEKLRDMLQVDTNVSVISEFRDHTVISGDRFATYVALLKSAGGEVAFRSQGNSANPGIGIWSSGMGDRVHIGITWLTNSPTNQILSMDQHFKTHATPPPVYQHIDQNWYIWADW